MKILFDHDCGAYNEKFSVPLCFVKAKREKETCKYMFENGWIPYGKSNGFWYQARSSRIKLDFDVSRRKRKALSELKVTYDDMNLLDLENPPSLKEVESYAKGKHIDIFFDGIFGFRLNFYEDQLLGSLMNRVRHKNGYGTLVYYYIMENFCYDYEYLYISDYYDQFIYKMFLPSFEYWNGSEWKYPTEEEFKAVEDSYYDEKMGN